MIQLPPFCSFRFVASLAAMPRPDAINASIVYQDGSTEEVRVHRAEYKCEALIKHLYMNGWCMGRDGSLLSEDDYVWSVDEKKVMQLDYCSGSHKLRFQSGEISIAPMCLTKCDEYVFAHDLILLRGEGKRVGPVARALGGLVRAFRQKSRAKRQRLV